MNKHTCVFYESKLFETQDAIFSATKLALLDPGYSYSGNYSEMAHFVRALEMKFRCFMCEGLNP